MIQLPEVKRLSAAVAAAMPRHATLALYASPLSTEPDVLLPVPFGGSIQDLLPPEFAHECIVCRYQGLWLLRADWRHTVLPGDMVEFHVRPQSGGNSNALRTILQIVVLVVAYVYAPYLAGAEYGLFAGASEGLVAAGLTIAGNLAINALIPVAAGQGGGAAGPQASPSYNTALSGNAARLDGAIPVLYGFNRTFPDFAGQPYSEYDNATFDQYYYALFALGHGEFTVPKIEIDDTPLSSFADVEFNILAPGEAPTLVDPAVVTAIEVTGQEIPPGRYIGPFAASGPDSVATDVAFDIVLGGLGFIGNDGGVSSKTVSLRFEVKEIDYWGEALGVWVIIGTEDITEATVDSVRKSFRYALPAAGRYLVRAVRTNAKDESRQALNSPSWTGLRAYLEATSPLEPSVTHIEVKMRATEQLNGLSQRKIAVTSLRLLETYNGSSWSGIAEETRNPAWVLADKWRSTVYGDALPDSRIDLDSLYELAGVWEDRQDRCDIVFDTFSDSASIDQIIANTGRAAVINRNGIRTVVRDQVAGLPVTAYSSRMMRPGTWSQSYGLPTSESADGYVIEYWNNRAWDWLSIECPAPGRTYADGTHPEYDTGLPSMNNPVRQRILGVTGATHAEREGRYMAAKLVYRRNIASWGTELQGILPAYGSAVVVAPALPSWGQTGDVVEWDETGLEMDLSEPPLFDGVSTYGISLVRDNGTLHNTIICTPGSVSTSVVLAEAPDFELVYDDLERERPKYVFGPVATHRKIARMLAIEPAGLDDAGTPVINHTAVIEDDRVHEADLALLPDSGEDQDPINLSPVSVDSGEEAGGATLLFVGISDRMRAETIYEAACTVSYSLQSDGRVRITTTTTGDTYITGQWLFIAPTTTNNTGLFAARCTVTGGALTSGPTGTWDALDTTRTWAVSAGAPDTTAAATFTIEIRDVDTETVQDTAAIDLSATYATEGA